MSEKIKRKFLLSTLIDMRHCISMLSSSIPETAQNKKKISAVKTAVKRLDLSLESLAAEFGLTWFKPPDIEL